MNDFYKFSFKERGTVAGGVEEDGAPTFFAFVFKLAYPGCESAQDFEYRSAQTLPMSC